jgi:pyruvate kinase
MLSAETATGAYPARAVETLSAIIRAAEANTPDEAAVAVRWLSDDHDHGRALCAAAVMLATRGDARAIVAVTTGGSTARQLSALRPKARILAITTDAQVARRLALHWGVMPICLDGAALEDARRDSSVGPRALVTLGHLAAGETGVIININPDLSRPDANYLRIQRL